MQTTDQEALGCNEQQQGPQIANGDEMRALIRDRCSISNDATADRVFQGSVRASLNALYGPLSPSPAHGVFERYPTRYVPNSHGGGLRDLDGYTYSNFNGEMLTSAILEVKNSSNITDANVQQAQDHILYLATQSRPGTIWAPTYFYASHAGERNPRILAMAAFANARGVNFAHVSIHRRFLNPNELYVETGAVGAVLSGNGPLPWWEQLIRIIDRSFDFGIHCGSPETLTPSTPQA